MNGSEPVQKYVDNLKYLVDSTEEGHPVREEAEKVLEDCRLGRDVTKHMPWVKFQCLKCKEVFDTEKKYRVHAGMNTHCGRVSREKSRFDSIDEQMNVINLQ